MTPSPPEVEIVDLSKRFGAVQALDAVSVRFTAGRMHALLGENGAGKSTLVKCLMGYYQADAGRILVDRQARAIAHPYDVHVLGLGNADHSGSDDCKRYLGLAVAKHFRDGGSLHLTRLLAPQRGLTAIEKSNR